ncbi:3-keto-5-aminohexanoate cleavage protein [Sphingobium estronivorans]|uniref:3-keto-5-aminohexanoate cleavage protein n=1 Tax=Sphingobium estronivorans TaxID=1577690 RepID=UPI0013C33CF0|nr:3-keto-5-aminohexanoate cleavage protein [Sphingobium estronivorans]
MTLAEQGKVMVRIAVNEYQKKETNTAVPYTAEEIAEDAIRCGKAGGTIVHFHSRTADGRQALDNDRNGASLYRAAIDLTARQSDIVMEPTNLPYGIVNPSSTEDLPHIWSLDEQPPEHGGLETVNIDAFRFEHLKSGYDVHRNRLVTIDEKQSLRPDVPFRLPACVQEVLNRGYTPFFGVFNLSDLRLLGSYGQEGLIPTPVLVSINFFCDLMWGPTPSVEALDAYLWQWRRMEVDSEINLFVTGLPDMKSYEYFQEATLDRGIGMRVGLGDHASIFPGGNAQMVDHYVDLLIRRGFRPATPNDLRDRVGMASEGRRAGRANGCAASS